MASIEIPLQFRDAPEWLAPLRPPSLVYECGPYAPGAGRRIQPVLAGRNVLVPRVNLDHYRTKAVIDWIEIWLHTPGEHQSGNMYKFARKVLDTRGGATSVFVSGPNRKPGYQGQTFILKFHDPAPGTFRKVLHDLVERYDADVETIDELAIASIEISVDFYVRKSLAWDVKAQDLHRWEMVDLLRRHLRPEPVLTEQDRCHPRVYGAKLGGSGATFVVETRPEKMSGLLLRQFHHLGVDDSHRPVLQPDAHNPPFVDQTHWIGASDFIVMLRSMDKITDRRDPDTGEAVDLPPTERRARLEVTLQGAPDEVGGHGAVDLETVGDLYGFRFQHIRKSFFEFFLPTLGPVSDTETLPFPVKVTEEEVFKRSGVYGLDRLHRAIEAVNLAAYKKGEIAEKPQKLRKKGRLISYNDLNRRFDTALKGLTKAWKL